MFFRPSNLGNLLALTSLAHLKKQQRVSNMYCLGPVCFPNGLSRPNHGLSRPKPIKAKSAECVYQGLVKWIHRWGAPLKILSDQGKEFNNKV